ncbi:dihydrodipicolinate reductase C-terminal domain-containing protein [Nocardia niigatensis]
MISGGVGIVGVTGRLGSAIAETCRRTSTPIVTTASTAGWRIGDGRPEVVIDASRASALPDTLDYCDANGSALLYCVSNPPERELRELRRASERIPVAMAANLSPLHWIQARAAATAAHLAAAIGYDVETTVIDRHPATKQDAPSATARLLLEQAGGAGMVISERYGLPVSDHRLLFTGQSETLELTHSVRDLHPAAEGALRLAARLTTLSPGWYTADQLYAQLAAHLRSSHV